MANKKYTTFNIDVVIANIQEAATIWHVNHSKEKITNKVNTQLNNSLEEITAKLLGFDKSWGKWEIDHCNGRAGQSDAGRYFSAIAKEAIQEWFKTVELPPMNKAMQANIKKEYKSALFREARSILKSVVTEQATKQVNDLIKEITESEQCDKIIKLQKLVD